MSTFGQTTGTTYFAGDTHDAVLLGKYTLAEDGDVSKLTAYIGNQGAGHGACYVMAVIYNDDGSAGAPSTLVGTGSATLIADNAAAANVDLAFASAVSLTAGDWWLGWISDTNCDGLQTYVSAATGGAWYFTGDTYVDGPANPCSSPPYATGAHKLVVFATYTVTASGIAIPLLNHLLLGD
jgi:hypothetical protein